MENEYRKAFITITSKKDNAGRQLFTIQRKSDQIGYNRNLTGYFGQVFFGVLEEHIKRIEGNGGIVVFIDKEIENDHIDTKTGLLKCNGKN